MNEYQERDHHGFGHWDHHRKDRKVQSKRDKETDQERSVRGSRASSKSLGTEVVVLCLLFFDTCPLLVSLDIFDLQVSILFHLFFAFILSLSLL